MDVASLESLIGALSSTDDAEVVAALDLLARRKRTRLVPLLILYHPAEAVLVRALDLFTDARREDVAGMALKLLGHPSGEVRAAALRALPAPEAAGRGSRLASEIPHHWCAAPPWSRSPRQAAASSGG